ncbi:MAG: response regulator transcription factor [Dehalococcoidia bacterium]|nr:response regulator transcription factor [Dehalococcoidia bacterium]
MKIRVLLADDHALVREGIRSLLQLNEDIEVVGEAGDGNEAINKARELKPDVVVMDISMPSVSGVDATRQILKENPAIRVVVLSRHDNLMYARSLLDAGALAYVPKKAASTELASAIRAAYRGEVFLHPSIARGVVNDYMRLVQSEQKTGPLEQLSEREREILRLVAEGYSSHQIADRLFLTVKTVLNYRNNIRHKLGVDNTAQLIKYAIKIGLVEDEPGEI